MDTVLALLSSLMWGTSDFFGGTLSRRLAALDVVLGSQGLSLLGILVVAAVTTSFGAPTGYLPWAVAAGVVGVLALAAFYRALAEGTMGVVAPIAATGVVIPVVAGVALGDTLDTLQVVGIAAAITGVVAAGRSAAPRGASPSRRPVVLAVLAAVGFGLVIWFLARGGRSSVVMTLVAMRVTSVVVLAAAAGVIRRRPGFGVRDLPALGVVGGFDLAANGTYAVAATGAQVSVVAVLASLYPAVTVLLARRVHHERLARMQQAGVILALAGVVLIGAGGGAA